MKTFPDMIVMGDINLDWVAIGNLPFPFTDLKANGVITWSPIRELPGGSGLNFARFARDEGYRPMLLGKVGNDLAGRFLEESLADSGIDLRVTRDPSLGTGKAMIVRDKHEIRFLVNNRENANHALSVEDVETNRGIIESCRILYVSGYCIMNRHAPRASATLYAMELAHDPSHPKGRLVVFDVVPHRIYEMYSFDEFRELTKKVDILISEVTTLRRFLGLGSQEEKVDRAIAEETVERLKDHYRRFILRYGPSGCDEQVLCDAANNRLKWESANHKEAVDKRGYGDWLAVRALREFFGIEPTA